MKRSYSNFLLRLFLANLLLSGCSPASQQSSTQNPAQTPVALASPQPAETKQNVPQPSANERLIWSGTSGGVFIRWTTSDLYVESKNGTEKIFAPLVNKEFADFAAEITADDGTGDRLRIEDCTYDRYFKVLSVVGTLVSFEDRYSYYCSGTYPPTDNRFITVDLVQPGKVSYASGEEVSGMDVDLNNTGKIVKLTDYFAEDNILHALLNDTVIKKALAGSKKSASPHSLKELPELFADDFYGLGDTGFELRPDFLTRFAFHHVEGDRVALRLSLPPHYGANRHEHLELGLLLPIPEKLRQPLASAAAGQEGYLMKNAPKSTRNLITEFRFGNENGQ